MSPKKNTKNHNQHLFWCASHPLISSPLPLPEITSKSEYMQCFCSVNGFMLSSRHQKGSVLALILCLYWAGGGFKPSSIFGVYSKLSDLRAFYWCSISDIYREALLSLEQAKNSHNILPLHLTRFSAETLSHPESPKVALPQLTGLENRNMDREKSHFPFQAFWIMDWIAWNSKTLPWDASPH